MRLGPSILLRESKPHPRYLRSWTRPTTMFPGASQGLAPGCSSREPNQARTVAGARERPRQNRHSPHPSESSSEVSAGEAGYGLAVVSGGAASAGFARVEGACEAGAGLGECGVRAAAARARWMAGADGLRAAGGAAVAEGSGGVSGGGPPLGGAGPPPAPPGPVARRRPVRASGAPGAGARAVDVGRQAASGTPPRLLPAPPPCASVHPERCTLAPLPPTIGWSALTHIIPAKEILNGD